MKSKRCAVMVVDDDEDIRATLLDLIEERGHRVVTARNGREALEILKGGEEVCVIFLDLMMPVMDGWQFRKEQLADAALARIPVVVITAAGKSVSGVTEVLEKPLRIEHIYDVVDAHCP